MENIIGPVILFTLWFMVLLVFGYLHPMIGIFYLIGTMVVAIYTSDP